MCKMKFEILEPISEKELSKIETPITIKNKELMAPGVWNDTTYTAEEIHDAFINTNWKDKDNISLFLDHKDLETTKWAGWIKNPRLDGDRLIGDLEVWDDTTAKKLVLAKAKFGISPKLKGIEDREGALRNFTYKNFSIVTKPAVRTAYINLIQKETENADISAFEAERKKRGMSPAEFYAAPRDPPSKSALPIFDASHVRNALARFNQTHFESESEKAKAKSKIIASAKKFGIKVSDNLNQKGGQFNMSEEEIKKKPEEGEDAVEETQEEDDKKKKNPDGEEMSEEEMLEVTQNPAWSNFVKKMKESNPKMPFKEIANAFKKNNKDKEELENMSESDLIAKVDSLLSILKNKNKDPEKDKKDKKEEKQMEELKELKSEIKELRYKVNKEPNSVVTKALAYNNSKPISNASMAPTPSKGVLAMAEFLKREVMKE